MTEFLLTSRIMELSNDKSCWDAAKAEWSVYEIYEHDAGTCLCGHYPIIEHCKLKNSCNGNEVIVGNCCVNKFMLKSDKLFKSRNRVLKDISKPFNADCIIIAYNQGIINYKDRVFYLATWRRKMLQPKQIAWRIDINKRILKQMGGEELETNTGGTNNDV